MPDIGGHEEIYVVSHGWHTGIVIPAKRIQNQIPELRQRFGDIPYIEFGWGDHDYYQAKEETTGITLKAVVWPTDSVIHAVAVPKEVDKFFANSVVEGLCLSGRGYSSLVRYISESFYEDEYDELVELKSGLYGNSQFYKAVGDFHLMSTCNSWTAKGLKSAGMDISPAFKLTADSIMDYLKEFKQSPTMDSTTQSKTTSLRSVPFDCQ